MNPSLKGQVLCAEQKNGPDRWSTCDDRVLVQFGGTHSWNKAGEVERTDCILRPWDGKEVPFHCYL
jgi:hypothetical protein